MERSWSGWKVSRVSGDGKGYMEVGEQFSLTQIHVYFLLIHYKVMSG